jgi:hypothetical protein
MNMTSNTLAWSCRRLAPLLVALCWASPALAQTEEEKRAEQLFREGRDAVDRSDYATGCAKFAESLRLTQRPGPLLNLANCEEHQGRFVSALTHWTDGIALLPANDERVAAARQRVEALSRRIPRITIVLAASAPEGSKVTLDGAPISPAALGVPQPTDLGEHVVVAAAPGHTDARSTLLLGEGERREITVTPGMSVAAPPSTVAPPPIVTPPPPPSSDGARTAGFVIGGVGAASLAVGVVTGILTIGKKSTVDGLCPSTCFEKDRAAVLDAESAGKTLSTISTVTFIAGGVGLAAGLVLVLSSGPRHAPTTATLGPAVLPGGGGLSLGGSF